MNWTADVYIVFALTVFMAVVLVKAIIKYIKNIIEENENEDIR